ncbi:hypothetical protein [Pseudomonas soli]|uniref:hypothetical protein n=1 Tax=Pseudomonas TaxID=286 RepID=UPI0039DF5033
MKHNLDTAAGGRGYIAELFTDRLNRHDFTRYINDRLACDFACALAMWLEPLLAKLDAIEQIESLGGSERVALLLQAQEERNVLMARNEAMNAVLEEVLENAERGLPAPLHRKLRQLLPRPVPARANEAERPGFEEWHCGQFATKHLTGQPTRDLHNGVRSPEYGPPNQQQMWLAWQGRAARCSCNGRAQ